MNKGIFLLSLMSFYKIYSISNDVNFWSEQFKEHAEFCRDFTRDLQLKNKATQFSKNFAQLQNSNNSRAFLEQSKQIKDFQKQVDRSLDKNDPDYTIKHDLIDHMNKETDYAIKRVQSGGRLSKDEEIKFWNEEHLGETKATAYFMTTGNGLKNHTKQVEKILEKDKSLKAVELANAELDQLSEILADQPQKTRMPKKLAEHEERERQRAKQIFQSLSIKK